MFTASYRMILLPCMMPPWKWIRSGVEDILYFYNSTSYSGKKKLAGYRAAMEEKGLLTNGSFLQLYQGSHEDIPAMADQLLKLHAKGITFHGVIAADDSLALGALKYAREMKLRIPEDWLSSVIIIPCW